MADTIDDLHSRRIYSHRGLSGISQGSILSGINLKEYPDKECWGLVITPRCDLARGIKYATFHVLPIINLCDWLNGEGQVICAEQNRKTVQNKFNALLPAKEFSENILSSGLSKTHIKNLITTSTSIKPAKKEEAVQLLEGLMGNDYGAIIKSAGETAIKNLVEDLKKDRHAAYHVMEPWSPSDSEIKILCLRKVLEMSREIGLKYKQGFMEEEIDNEVLRDNHLLITPNNGGVYEIEAVVASPFMEHLMQRFANNFIKIGVEDRPVSLGLHLESTIRKEYGKSR